MRCLLCLLIVFVAADFSFAQQDLSLRQQTGQARPRGGTGSRLATYDTATGETFFAFSLKPAGVSPSDKAREIVVLVDTSASQTGAYKDESVEALEALIDGLSDRDRVDILAVDLLAIPMMPGLRAPRAANVREGIDRLKKRVPLGATDLPICLQMAVKRFSRQRRSRVVLYIGDGISGANSLDLKESRQLLEMLVREQVSVSSFALGPQLDVQLLAALANHTGGTVAVDNDEISPQQAGLGLSRAVRATVCWPQQVKKPAAFTKVLPVRIPPFRSDRDTILIGQMKRTSNVALAIKVIADGKSQILRWSVPVEKTHDDFSFLPQLVREAQPSGGVALPTVGSVGLREVARMITSTADELLKVAKRSLSNGDLEGARRVADAVLRRDPNHPEAQLVKKAIAKQKKKKVSGRLRKKK